jgi:hypothetical protein
MTSVGGGLCDELQIILNLNLNLNDLQKSDS